MDKKDLTQTVFDRDNIDFATQTALKTLLKGTPIQRIEAFFEVTSTNKLLKALADQMPTDCLMVADSQTDGIGRYGRKFFSPKNSGLYFSLLLRPQIPINTVTNLTVAMAVAVVLATEEFVQKKCAIKWVNDILIDGKKVCGILTEGAINAETLSLDYAIVGVGINLRLPQLGFDQSIRDIADAINLPNSRKYQFLTLVFQNFYAFLQDLTSQKLFDEYQKRLAFVGHSVDILKNGEKIAVGEVLGIDKNYKLSVKTPDGATVVLDSGEISAKPN